MEIKTITINISMKPKKITILTATFIATLAFATSCSNNGTKQNIVGGLIEGMLAEGSNSEQIDTLSNTASDNQHGIEIPAKLNDRPEQILKREGYTTSYNKNTKQPNWVAWHLTADHTSGHCKRDGIDFQEDPDVPSPRATDNDYYRSRYDRGHQCPAGDNKWSITAMQQSFLFTNICPQAPSLNRGDWNELENTCRKWAKHFGSIYIACGPIFKKGSHKTIGKHKIHVPEAFFKVVLCIEGTPKAIGFIYQNDDGNHPTRYYAKSVDEVEKATRIDFFPSLKDNIEQKVESQYSLESWDIE